MCSINLKALWGEQRTKYMNNYRKLVKSNFVRNVFLVVTGTAGAQIITMLFAPIITRMYGAEAFGVLGTFAAILSVLTPIAAMAYPIAIVLPKSDKDAQGIAKLSVYIAIIISMVLFTVIFLFDGYLAKLFNLELVTNYLLLIPAAVFFAALQQVMLQWLIRKKQFKVTARIAVSQSFIINSAKAGVGVYSPVAAVLIILATLGNALYAIQLWIGANKWSSVNDRIASENIPKTELKKLAYKHRDFPLYRAPQQFINALSQSLPVLMLASFFGPAAAGFYALGKTVLGVPSTLIGKAVGDVFYPRITEAAHNNENLFKLVLKATLALAVVGIIPFGIVIVLGPWLFGFVFGDEWVVAGEYARWLSLWLYFMFMNPPCNKVIPVLGIQGFYLFFTCITLAIRFAAMFVGYYVYNSDMISILFYSLSGAIINIVLIGIVLHKSRLYDKGKEFNG